MNFSGWLRDVIDKEERELIAMGERLRAEAPSVDLGDAPLIAVLAELHKVGVLPPTPPNCAMPSTTHLGFGTLMDQEFGNVFELYLAWLNYLDEAATWTLLVRDERRRARQHLLLRVVWHYEEAVASGTLPAKWSQPMLDTLLTRDSRLYRDLAASERFHDGLRRMLETQIRGLSRAMKTVSRLVTVRSQEIALGNVGHQRGRRWGPRKRGDHFLEDPETPSH